LIDLLFIFVGNEVGRLKTIRNCNFEVPDSINHNLTANSFNSIGYCVYLHQFKTKH